MDNSTKSSKFRLLLLLVGGVILLLVVGGLVAYPKAKQRWTAPLGPGLELPTYTPTDPYLSASRLTHSPTAVATKPLESPTPQDTKSFTPTTVPSATLQPTASREPLCGGPPIMYILGLGIDTKDESYTYGLADVIRIARVDFDTPKVTMLSIPRDLWVEIPEIEDYGVTHGKINQAFFYGSPGMNTYDGPGAGPGLFARTLEKNFDMRVDHYGALNMLVFEKIINAVGGIDIYLPTDVDGTPTDRRTHDMGYFYAGQQHFNGDEAVRFSRIRKRYSDYQRMDNQNMVICALREKILSPTVLPKIPQIIASFQGSVITDLSLEQLSQLACLLPNVKSENLIFTGLPPEILKSDRIYSPQMRDETFATQTDMEVVRDYFHHFKAGTWPSQPKE
jgi:LCP family protein required for cell wall assembly